MSSLAIAAILGGGGAVALAASKPVKDMAPAVQARPTLGFAASPGATTGQLSGGATFIVSTSTSEIQARNAALLSQIIGGGHEASFTPLSTSAPAVWEPALQEKLDLIKQYGEAAYAQMSSSAKKAAAAKLSQELKLDPPLTGDEDWNAIAKIAGGAAGAAAFGWIPSGQVWGPIVGAYLGVKLEDLMSKHGDEIKAWFSSRWAGIESWVKSTASGIADEVGSWFGAIF